MMRPTGKEGKMNRAEATEPKGGHKAPAPAAGVGNEKKANVRGAQNGNPEDSNPLRHATRELQAQHPHPYHSHGPHHDGTEHIRHHRVGKVYES